jgi:hypothetical protein
MDDRTVSERGLDHRNCSYSTGIDGSVTSGQGKLDWSGWWSIPCPDCAMEYNLGVYDCAQVS